MGISVIGIDHVVLGRGRFQLFFAVSSTVVPTVKNEKFLVAVYFKGKNGTFLPLTVFNALLITLS